ncbi:arsenate reductase (glutaredoxin) [Ramlibacter sp. USB13]|uniref:Arsenate reductase n=1 Tax=Ramlibacter cellulosilyticus TaxID=2764187 RepID=A0A923SD89_9BURK|nr:arsenate reductase (glutaredoxin) [Ramlibacter cellulosilyticus]
MSDDITLFHNPACGTSRTVLARIREAGLEPRIVEYLKTPPTKEQLRSLVAAMGTPVRAILREKEPVYAQLGLADPKWSEEQLLDFVVQHPILLNRPVVASPLGTRVCRPAEEVDALLPRG